MLTLRQHPLVAGLVLAVALCSSSSAPASDLRAAAIAEAIVRYDIGVARLQVDRHCRALRIGACARPETMLRIVVGQMPSAAIEAYTTKAQDGICTTHFSPTSIVQPLIVAHEVCHCANDYEVIGDEGYVGIGLAEVARREAGARQCALETLLSDQRRY